ncbi:hypothetical protein [Streptomyces sp. NPDC059708]
MTDRPTGTCPSCGQTDLPITRTGTIGLHVSRTIGGFRQKCPGVDQPPAQ